MVRFSKVLMLLLASSLAFAPFAVSPARAVVQGDCIPDGGIDDTLGRTDCCSGQAVPDSTYCFNSADDPRTGGSGASCTQICATAQ